MTLHLFQLQDRVLCYTKFRSSLPLLQLSNEQLELLRSLDLSLEGTVAK